ncbi:hypothetical protein DMO00_24755, partial [Vibrio parahaemolyticus]|nr:hypothetical protein [Vibrio parahaemolyticus]
EGKMEDDFDIYPTNEAFYIECLYGHTNSALDSVYKVGEWIQLVVENDEKLDCYLTQNHVGQFIPLDIAAEQPKSDVPLHIFRGFYINPRIFVLLGNKYELTPIVAELEFVHNQLSDCIKNGYRLPTEYA